MKELRKKRKKERGVTCRNVDLFVYNLYIYLECISVFFLDFAKIILDLHSI